MLTNEFVASVEARARREQIQNTRRGVRKWIRRR